MGPITPLGILLDSIGERLKVISGKKLGAWSGAESKDVVILERGGRVLPDRAAGHDADRGGVEGTITLRFSSVGAGDAIEGNDGIVTKTGTVDQHMEVLVVHPHQTAGAGGVIGDGFNTGKRLSAGSDGEGTKDEVITGRGSENLTYGTIIDSPRGILSSCRRRGECKEKRDE